MFCPHCGNKLPDVAQFCSRCGNPVEQPAQTNSAAERAPEPTGGNTSAVQSSGDKGFKIAVAVGAVLGVALLIALVIIIKLLAGGEDQKATDETGHVESGAIQESGIIDATDDTEPEEIIIQEDEDVVSINEIEPAQTGGPVTRSIQHTDFVGEYVGDDPDFDALNISWDNGTMEIACYGYRITNFVATVIAGTELAEDNTLPFIGTDDFGLCSGSLTYVPASKSPYRVDTIYAQWGYSSMAFKRTPDSSRYNP